MKAKDNTQLFTAFRNRLFDINLCGVNYIAVPIKSLGAELSLKKTSSYIALVNDFEI